MPDGWARPLHKWCDEMWFSKIPCIRCAADCGPDGMVYLLGSTDEDAIAFCADCAIRLFDGVQNWYAMTQVGA